MSDYLLKKELPVCVKDAAGATSYGWLFVYENERLLDLLNDPQRQYVPLKHLATGEAELYNKAHLVSVREVTGAELAQHFPGTPTAVVPFAATTPPTHYCTQCGAHWRLNDDLSWTLRSAACGACCDNADMGDQIVPLGWRAAEVVHG